MYDSAVILRRFKNGNLSLLHLLESFKISGKGVGAFGHYCI